MTFGISQNCIAGIVMKTVYVLVQGDKSNQKFNYYYIKVEKRFSFRFSW